MALVSMSDLLKSGVHFGHQTRRWNPKMKPFIMTERNGIYIIDLQQSLQGIETAYDFVKETVAHNGTILFVGTKKQAQETIQKQAQRANMPYVNHRWLGGMLTNFKTVSDRLKRLKELEEIDYDDVAGSSFTKKELLMKSREKEKLERTLGGIRSMGKLPSAVWVVDTNKEHLAVAEARKLNIPVIAVLDTNCDPDEVDYAIAGNDDAIRAVEVLTRVIADACAQGVKERLEKKAEKENKQKEEAAREDADNAEEKAESESESDALPAWEKELLGGNDASSDQKKTEGDMSQDTASSDSSEEKKTAMDSGEQAVENQAATDQPAALQDPAAGDGAEENSKE